MKKEDLIALGLDEEMAKKVAAASLEELHDYVPKSRIEEVTAEKNAMKATLAERDKQLTELQAGSKDSEALNQRIAELIKANADAQAKHDAEMKQLKVDNAIEKALSEAGVLNSKATKALLDLENVELAEDGTIKGLDKQIENLKTAEDSKFLFKSTEQSQTTFKGVTPQQQVVTTAGMNEWEVKLAEARKKGDTLSAITIKREAAEKGINLL